MQDAPIFFTGWNRIVQILVVGTLGYILLVLALRIYGKRTLTKMNMFDFVVTVALGSTFASMLVAPNVPLFEGIAALFVLLTAQRITTWLSVKSRAAERLIKASPRLLFYNGYLLTEAMRDEGVTKSEVLSAIRSEGVASLDAVLAVVLENNGTMSVIHHPEEVGKPINTLIDVPGQEKLETKDNIEAVFADEGAEKITSSP
ncbi:MAG: DUF421 domain-containing protein [Anaerolineae bacterium]